MISVSGDPVADLKLASSSLVEKAAIGEATVLPPNRAVTLAIFASPSP